jgi:Protein of unknown function (DUF3768)
MSAPFKAAERAERIARLNDRARQAMGLCCIAVATPGFRALPWADQSRVRELIETFDAFSPDNDPHGERDFGAIYQTSDGRWTTARPIEPSETVFWQIDCYDLSLEWASEDPTDPAVTRRILTIMLADEY